MDDELASVIESYSTEEPKPRSAKKNKHRSYREDDDEDDFDAIDDDAEYHQTPNTTDDDDDDDDDGYGMAEDAYDSAASNEVVRKKKKAAASPSVIRTESSDDEDLVEPADEGSRMRPIEKRAVAGVVHLCRHADRKRTAYPASCIIKHGKSRMVPSLKPSHINEVVTNTIPKDLAYLKIGAEYIHALSLGTSAFAPPLHLRPLVHPLHLRPPLARPPPACSLAHPAHPCAVDPTGDRVTYYELNNTEEQKIVRGILLSAGGMKKPDYEALVKEQMRWDTKMDDMDTSGAELPGRYKSCFPVYKVETTGRRRAFILSTNFIENRRERARKRAEKDAAKKKSAATIDSDDEVDSVRPSKPIVREREKEIERKAQRELIIAEMSPEERTAYEERKKKAEARKAEAKERQPAADRPVSLKVTDGRRVVPGEAASDKPRLDPKAATLMNAIKKRAVGAPKKDAPPSNPFEFAARSGEASPRSKRKRDDAEEAATPDRPIQRRTGPGHPPNAPKRIRPEADDEDGAYCIIVRRITPARIQTLVDMICE